jgi:hypothetical protein
MQNTYNRVQNILEKTPMATDVSKNPALSAANDGYAKTPTSVEKSFARPAGTSVDESGTEGNVAKQISTPSRNPSQAPEASFAVGSGEVKHTPGPWRATPDYFGDFTIQPAHEELAIAGIVNGACRAISGGSTEQAANAALIAAAPDMLEALWQCVGSLKALGAEDGFAASAARAAIAKATLTPGARS